MTLILGQTGSNIVDGTTGTDTLTYETLGGAIGSITLIPQGAFSPTNAIVGKELGGTDILSSIERIIAPTGKINRIDASTAPSSVSISVILWKTNADNLQVTTGSGTSIFTANNFRQVIGGNGNDLISGNFQNNTIEGGNGDDVIDGNLGDNIIDGGAGNDIIFVGSGNNLAIAGSGINEIRGHVSGNDTLDGLSGGGIDTVNYNLLPSAITMDTNSPGIVTKSGGTDTLLGIENIAGTNFNDVIIGDMGNNILIGRDGNDVLRGIGGNNRLEGGNGNDTLQTGPFGEEGFDTLIGGNGVDRYSVAVVSKVTIIDNGQGTLATGDTVVDLPNLPNITGIKNIRLTNVNDNFAVGNSLDNRIVSTAFRNGMAGNDTLDGGGGSANTLEGGRGNDLYVVRSAGDVVIERLSQGNDTIESHVSYTLPANVENLFLVSGTGDTTGTGNARPNLIIGNEGNNQLSGVRGNNTLQGGEGNDTLIGGLNRDILEGGQGADVLIGGTAITTFVYNDLTDSLLNAFDTVQGFNAAIDFFQTSNPVTFSGDLGNAADLTELSIQSVLGTFAPNTAAIFGIVGNPSVKYLAINDGVAGFSASSDAIIDISGFTGTMDSANFVV